MRPGYNSRGQFFDWVPHPDYYARKLEQMKLLQPEGQGRPHRAPPEIRRPQNRDWVSGEEMQAIQERLRKREAAVRTEVLLQATTEAESVRSKALRRLKDGASLTPEERGRLEAISKSTVSALVAQDAERLEAEIAARLAQEPPSPVVAKG